MANTSAGLWPWLALAALGFYHGINPAMGWLFAVALGLQRKSQRTLFISLIPIACGHAVSVALMLGLFLTLGLVVDRVVLARIAAAALILWALFHIFYGHRQRPVVGLQTGLLGLAIWSFLMASAHGAGLMLVPALLPLCGDISASLAIGGPLRTAAAALAMHTAVMLATIALVAALVYNWIDIGFLRRGWINLDCLWVGALLVGGILLLAL
jgi:hypothetical protein